MKLKIKTILSIIFAIILLVVVIFAAYMSKTKDQREKEKLNNEFILLTKDFYKDYYYNIIASSDEDRKSKLSQFKDLGIMVSLDDMTKYDISKRDEKLKKFTNYKTGASCDYENSKAKIFPYEPYGKEDIRVEVDLICGL